MQSTLGLFKRVHSPMSGDRRVSPRPWLVRSCPNDPFPLLLCTVQCSVLDPDSLKWDRNSEFQSNLETKIYIVLEKTLKKLLDNHGTGRHFLSVEFLILNSELLSSIFCINFFFTCVNVDPHSEYGSTNWLNSVPVWIRIHTHEQCIHIIIGRYRYLHILHVV